MTKTELEAIIHDDRGVAMVSVGLLGAFLVMLSIVVAMQTMQQSRSVDGDRNYEQAIHVSESGVDVALYELDPVLDGLPDTFDDPAEVVGALDLSDYFTVVAVPDDPTKADIVEIAEGIATTSPSAVIETPEGDVVLVAPDDGTLILYSVGFTPSLDAPLRKERVTVVEYYPEISDEQWNPELAILAEDSVKLGGDSVVSGGAHSNGTMSVGGPSNLADECATGLEPPTAVGPDCGDVTIEHHPLPAIDPLRAHYRAHYDVCSFSFSFGAGKPSGVYAGPAYPYGDKTPATPEEPCSGELVHPHLGLSGVGTTGVMFPKSFSTPGVFYVDGANVQVDSRKDVETVFTIIAGTVDGALDCSTSGGWIHVGGQGIYKPHPDGNNYAFIAGGDMTMNAGMRANGLLAAHEQVKYNGNIQIFGVLLIEGECNTPGSIVPETATLGTADITFDGSWTTDFILKKFEGVTLTRSTEL
jgi:hypothetical protein